MANQSYSVHFDCSASLSTPFKIEIREMFFYHFCYLLCTSHHAEQVILPHATFNVVTRLPLHAPLQRIPNAYTQACLIANPVAMQSLYDPLQRKRARPR